MGNDREPRETYPTWLFLIPPALWLAVMVDDLVLIPHTSGTLVLGLLDEPAHLATTLIVLVAAAVALDRGVRGPGLWFAIGAVVAGNLIDVDHVPELLGSDALVHGTARPYPHSLAT